MTLEEARDAALADAERTKGYEHIPFINEAYKKLKEDQNKPK